MTVWIVFERFPYEGVLHDEVVAVFADREDAEAYAKRLTDVYFPYVMGYKVIQ